MQYQCECGCGAKVEKTIAASNACRMRIKRKGATKPVQVFKPELNALPKVDTTPTTRPVKNGITLRSNGDWWQGQCPVCSKWVNIQETEIGDLFNCLSCGVRKTL